MRISGGSLTPFDIKVLPDFKPDTRLALQWIKLADGNYACTDRSAAGDVYESDIGIYGREQTITALLTALQINRNEGLHVITLDQFNDGEKIFGANIYYSDTISATVLELGRKKQQSLNTFSLDLRLRAIAPYTTGCPSLPALKPLIGYDGDSTFGVEKVDSYFGNIAYSDTDKDAGTFSATYHFNDTDMQSIRAYLANIRGGAFSVYSLNGATKPFGNRPATFPITVKAIKWKDLGMNAWGTGTEVRNWTLQMTLAEVV